MDKVKMPTGGLHLAVDRRSFLRATSILAAGGVIALHSGLPVYAQENSTELLKLYAGAKVDWQRYKGQTIVLGGLEHVWMHAIVPLISLFTQLTGIEVKVEKQSETEFAASMPVKLGGGSATPDIFMIWALGQAISAKWLQPLDAYRNDASLFDAAWYDDADIFSSARSFEKWSDGASYGLAITAEAQTLFMNKSMLDAKGFSAPASMDELFKLAKTLKSEEVAGIAMRAKPTGDAAPWTLAGFVFSYGGAYVTKDGKSGLTMPESIAGLDMYGRLLREAGPVGIAGYHWMECLNDFMQGAVAIGCDSSNFATDIEDKSKSTVAGNTLFGVLPAPANKSAKPNMWHWMTGINAKSANKEAAWLFLMWATSKPTSALTAAAGLATPRSSAWQTSAFRDRFGAQAADAALKNLQVADGDLFKAAWFHPKAPEILDAVGIAVNEVVTGSKDATQAFGDADGKVRQVLSM
ncbi:MULTISPECIES: ABC transporter substrate-binding protein [Phyllobacteriaceae]|nr:MULTISPECIES: extracellular solute-binding protein [Mesorhizobium]MBN9233962.1 extracellular solute-binding protein [Mesorhizobium sp.]MDQ0331493.1 multiple sugar transport system substrate-binding protein [Mesorhizobium sp. YL-MeA3-2017]